MLKINYREEQFNEFFLKSNETFSKTFVRIIYNSDTQNDALEILKSTEERSPEGGNAKD